MDEIILKEKLIHLISKWEHEVVEFKHAKEDFSYDKIGRYFSALYNEASVRGIQEAWLVFGVDDKTREVVGTNYRQNTEKLQNLKQEISERTTSNITFRNIYEVKVPLGRVILFEIPPPTRGIPVAWNGHYYGRNGESIVSLSIDKIESIRNQSVNTDWTAQIVPDAGIDDLDEGALKKARDLFAEKNKDRDVQAWTDEVFLNKIGVTKNGQMTRTAILLLGKPESFHFLSPNPAEITWSLEGAERAYEHFKPPFLLNTTKVYNKIRNIQLRLLPNDELLPHEVSKYDQKIILEALHNCIAHQDYNLNGRIIVNELIDKVILRSSGNFFDGKPEDYIKDERRPNKYRNNFLVNAMRSLNMIDTMGYGIFDMYKGQVERYLPMPDYDLSKEGVVSVVIYGDVVSKEYSKLLMQGTHLSFDDIIALDRVQKGLPINDGKIKHLRKLELIEGRKPNFYVSSSIAKATNTKADYMHKRLMNNNKHYKDQILDQISQFGEASRKEIDEYLFKILGNDLTNDKKKDKVASLLTSLRRSGKIYNAGSNKAPRWRIIKKTAE